jgi:hypothetical protein
MRAIDCHSLRLMDRRSVAIIDLAVILHVERDGAAIVEHTLHYRTRVSRQGLASQPDLL